MQRIIKTVLPCVFGAWAACAAFGQAPGDPRSNEAPQTSAPRKANLKAKAAADAQVKPAQGPAFAPPPRVADAAAAKLKMDKLLALWQEQSAKTETLDARFSREDFDSKWQEKTFFQGRAILKSPDLAFLDFQKVVGKEMKLVPYEQIRCTGKEVYQYLNERKQIYIYPLAKQERQRALEEGPLPFLFNMKADEANARYLMNLISENIQYYVITIQPRKAIDKSAFIRADVVLDRATFLPAGLKLYLPPDGKDVQTYRFTGDGHFIKPNVEVNEQNFQGKVLNGWDIVRDPGPSAPAPAPVDPQPVNQRRPAIGKAVQGGYPQRR